VSHGITQGAVEWNFAKFLCDEDGTVIARYAPYRPPNSMENDILEYLRKQPTPLPEPYASILQESKMLESQPQANAADSNAPAEDGPGQKKVLSAIAKGAAELLMRTTRRWSQMNFVSPTRRVSAMGESSTTRSMRQVSNQRPQRATLLSPKKVHVQG
jgi:hypothetical protein